MLYCVTFVVLDNSIIAIMATLGIMFGIKFIQWLLLKYGVFQRRFIPCQKQFVPFILSTFYKLKSIFCSDCLNSYETLNLLFLYVSLMLSSPHQKILYQEKKNRNKTPMSNSFVYITIKHTILYFPSNTLLWTLQ